MTTSAGKRLGLLALALTTITLGLGAPAHAVDGSGSIAGRLTDGGEPAYWTDVYASSVDGSSGGSGYTDGFGHYEIADLPAGDYRVTFEPRGHSTQYAYQTTNWDDAALITVTAGAQTTVDDSLLPTGTITGTFFDRSGAGRAGVQVRAEGSSGASAWTYSNTDGAYSLHVLPGDYTVSFQVGMSAAQYAPGVTGYEAAARYPVAVGQTVTVDDTLLASGSVAGRFSDRGGNGIPGVQVEVSSQGGGSYQATTDGSGDYRIDEVFTGSYTVAFSAWELNLYQYAYGKVDSSDADLFTVTEGATTTVNDSLLPTGSVHFTVTDALTGAPIPVFSAAAGQIYVEGADGSGTAENVPVGNEWIYASAEGYLTSGQSRVMVTEGATTEVAIALTPTAKITTKVVDARTGSPVAGFCVQAVVPTDFAFGDGCVMSDENGDVVLDHLSTGAYQLFAYGNPWEENRSPYGAQWVTGHGGTGDQGQARKIATRAGQTVKAPVIKLDKRGAITGRVRGSYGSPVKNAYVGFGNYHYYAGMGVISFPVAADGTYSVDFLGPYSWPLHFYADGYAPQWSGNTGSWTNATKITVKAKRTVTYNIKLVKGTKVTVETDETGWIAAYNAVTGETVGHCQKTDPAATCEMLIVGPQKVKFKAWGANGPWWHGGSDLATATPVWIPAKGAKTVTLTR